MLEFSGHENSAPPFAHTSSACSRPFCGQKGQDTHTAKKRFLRVRRNLHGKNPKQRNLRISLRRKERKAHSHRRRRRNTRPFFRGDSSKRKISLRRKRRWQIQLRHFFFTRRENRQAGPTQSSAGARRRSLLHRA